MKIRNSNLRAGRWRRVRQRLQNSSGKRITGMADPGSHKVDTHSVKNGFGTGHGQVRR